MSATGSQDDVEDFHSGQGSIHDNEEEDETINGGEVTVEDQNITNDNTQNTVTEQSDNNQSSSNPKQKKENKKNGDHYQRRPVNVPVTPRRFSGNAGSDAREYIQLFESTAKANYWSDEIMLAQLPLYLSNFASKWLKAATLARARQGKGDWTWEELKVAFIDGATECSSFVDDEYQFYNQTQRGDQSCLSFFYEMDVLANRCNNDVPEGTRVKYILRGLRPEVRSLIYVQDPKSMEELQKILHRYEENASIRRSSRTANRDDFVLAVENQPRGDLKHVKFSEENQQMNALDDSLHNMELQAKALSWKAGQPKPTARVPPNNYRNTSPPPNDRNLRSFDSSSRAQNQHPPFARDSSQKPNSKNYNSNSSRPQTFGDSKYPPRQGGNPDFKREGKTGDQREVSDPRILARTCYFCRQVGHYIRDCETRKKSMARQNQPQNSGNGQRWEKRGRGFPSKY
jgi:hypothetical protein